MKISVYKDEIYDLTEYFKIKNKDNKLKIILKVVSNITSMNNIFYDCSSLSFLHNISNLNNSNVTDMEHMFNIYSSISFLPDISKWNTSNVTDMKHMFYRCSLLSSLSDISKWDIKILNIRKKCLKDVKNH